MTSHTITVSRIVRDVQWRTIQVEAVDKDAAELAALDRANHEDGFWDDVKTDPIDSGSPEIEEIKPPSQYELRHLAMWHGGKQQENSDDNS